MHLWLVGAHTAQAKLDQQEDAASQYTMTANASKACSSRSCSACAHLSRSKGGASTNLEPISLRTKRCTASTSLSGLSTRSTISFWTGARFCSQGPGRGCSAGLALSKMAFHGACKRCHYSLHLIRSVFGWHQLLAITAVIRRPAQGLVIWVRLGCDKFCWIVPCVPKLCCSTHTGKCTHKVTATADVLLHR
jgi:hypothetical protein